FLPPDRLDVTFTLDLKAGPDARNARITGYGGFAARAERIPVIRRFLDSTGYGQAERRRIQGDASTRIYERLRVGNQRAILMNSPRRPDGAQRQTLQPDRPPRRRYRAIRRDGEWAAAARLLGPADLRSRAAGRP